MWGWFMVHVVAYMCVEPDQSVTSTQWETHFMMKIRPLAEQLKPLAGCEFIALFDLHLLRQQSALESLL